MQIYSVNPAPNGFKTGTEKVPGLQDGSLEAPTLLTRIPVGVVKELVVT